MTTAVSSSWAADAPLSVLEARAAGTAVHGLLLSGTPLVLRRPPPSDSSEPQQSACEVVLEWPSHTPLRCQQLKLEISCSARHVELFIEGVRRNLLGEDEHSEVYLGTFRGTKAAPTSTGAGATGAAPPQLFRVSEEFLQRNANTNVLKEMHRLRVKFVSLTGDKYALQLQELKCALVPLQVTQVAGSAHSAPSGMAAQLPGLGTGGRGEGGGSVALVGGLDVTALMRGFQETLEREMETKILRAVDEKLALLSQRLALSEHRLVQLHAQVDANGSHVQTSFQELKRELARLEADVQQQRSANSVREAEGDEAAAADISDA